MAGREAGGRRSAPRRDSRISAPAVKIRGDGDAGPRRRRRVTVVQASDVPRAVAAAASIATALGLPADEGSVVHASNRLAVRLLPADVLARVALPTHRA